MKKLFIIISTILITLIIASCGKKNSGSSIDIEVNNQKSELVSVFEKQIGKTQDLEKVAQKIADKTELTCMIEKMESGYFPGFDEEITGFKQAVGIMPMIGTIPFVAYIFEVEDPSSFKEMLSKYANPAWNICTQADLTVIYTKDNYVYFEMSPAK